MPTEVCPTDGELSEYTLGRLPADRLEAVAEHLDGCHVCTTRLVRLGTNSDPLAEAVRQVGRVAAYAPDATPPATLRDYRIEGVLGEGGMGTVYRATHTRLGRPVALKLLTARRRLDPDAATRFEREMRAIGALRHPNIVQPTDAGEIDGVPFLAMELLDGRDLERLVKDRGSLTVADACEAVRQAALGLQHAHDNGLVHRDVKPSNLMLTPDGTIKLLDLGLARTAELDKTAETTAGTVVQLGDLTATDIRVGTDRYMAPEQKMAPATVDARADVYALGRTLAYLLTGAPDLPVAGPVPGGLRKVLQQLQADDAAARYPTAAAAAKALRPWTAGNDLPAVAGRPARRRGRLARWLIVGLVLIVVAGTLFAAFGPREQSITETPHTGRGGESVPTAATSGVPAVGQLGLTPVEASDLQKRWAHHLGVEPTATNSVAMTLVLIPPGEFNLAPNARVRITGPYWIGTTEVTRGQFRQFVTARNYTTEVEKKKSGSRLYKVPHPKNKDALATRRQPDPRYSWQNPGYEGATDDHPVTMVSWNDAVAFCRWLSVREGKVYRLPTRSELQWAARAGESGIYPGSKADNLSYRSIEKHAWTFESSRDRPQPVGRLIPNAWGLYDVLGNADEMAHDWMGLQITDVPTGLHLDYQGPDTGTHRLNVGGGFNGRPGFETLFAKKPDEGTSEAGFRVLREP